MPSEFYHGSQIKFPDGFILTPQNDGYTSYPEVQKLEKFMEMHRPVNKLSRKNSVFMVADIDEIDSAGGYLDYVYLVEPLGRVEAADLSWYSYIDSVNLKGEEAKEAVKNYWNGTPFKDKSRIHFEYRTSSTRIIALVHEE